MDKRYTGLTSERFEALTSRYVSFQDSCNDLTKDPVKVFDPLSKKSLDDLVLIREVSKDLQFKKEEDAKRIAQAAQETVKEQKEEEKKESQE